MEVILQEVRSSLNGRLGRTHIITKRDLRNIQHSLPLDEVAERFYSEAADDAASAPPYIDEISPIVLQKQQGSTTALANTLSDEEFDKILTLCKGKYSKKLKRLRSRHANSLVQAMEATETIPCRQWLVQDDEIYTVNRVKESCEACELFCHECNACIHECTCADNSKHFNMCEHIHLICTKYYLSKPKKIHENHDDKFFMIAGMGDSHSHNTSEAEVDYPVVPRAEAPWHSSTLEQNRRKALQLLADATLFVQRIENNEQMTAIVERLKAVGPELEAVIAHSSSSANFEPTAESQRESPGKVVVSQRQYLSTKKKQKATSGSRLLVKPAMVKRQEIQNSLIISSSFPPRSEETSEQDRPVFANPVSTDGPGTGLKSVKPTSKRLIAIRLHPTAVNHSLPKLGISHTTHIIGATDST